MRRRFKFLTGIPLLYGLCLADLLINDYLSPKSLVRPEQMTPGQWEATLGLALIFMLIYGFTLIICPLIIVRRVKTFLAKKSSGEFRGLVLESLLFGFMFLLGFRLLIQSAILPLFR